MDHALRKGMSTTVAYGTVVNDNSMQLNSPLNELLERCSMHSHGSTTYCALQQLPIMSCYTSCTCITSSIVDIVLTKLLSAHTLDIVFFTQAMAKLYGSYENLMHGSIEYALRDLTAGHATTNYWQYRAGTVSWCSTLDNSMSTQSHTYTIATA
jgi:viroplasmin and RNaseH domain-containing protein